MAGLLKRSHKGGYFKERLAEYLCDLILETLAYRERVTPEIIKERLSSGTVDVPHDILAYLKVGLKHDLHITQKRKRNFLRSDDRPFVLDLDPERIITYLENELEHRMEVTRDIKT